MIPFIPLPYVLNFKSSKLHYKDVWTYVVLRSFYNYKEDDCFPSYDTLAKRAGLSRPALIDSIKRLEASGSINVKHAAKVKDKNHYSFANFDHWNPVPFNIIYHSDLTVHEKAMLLCLRQFFDRHSLTTCASKAEMARELGLSYPQLNTQYERLVSKGYIIPKRKVKYEGVMMFKPARLGDNLTWKWHPNKTSVESHREGLYVGRTK